MINDIHKSASPELEKFVINGRLKFPVKVNILRAKK